LSAIDRYDENIAYVDAAVDRLVQHLSLLGLLERTLIVVTADHGEQFLERGRSRIRRGICSTRRCMYRFSSWLSIPRPLASTCR